MFHTDGRERPVSNGVVDAASNPGSVLPPSVTRIGRSTIYLGGLSPCIESRIVSSFPVRHSSVWLTRLSFSLHSTFWCWCFSGSLLTPSSLGTGRVVSLHGVCRLKGGIRLITIRHFDGGSRPRRSAQPEYGYECPDFPPRVGSRRVVGDLLHITTVQDVSTSQYGRWACFETTWFTGR